MKPLHVQLLSLACFRSEINDWCVFLHLYMDCISNLGAKLMQKYSSLYLCTCTRTGNRVMVDTQNLFRNWILNIFEMNSFLKIADNKQVIKLSQTSGIFLEIHKLSKAHKNRIHFSHTFINRANPGENLQRDSRNLTKEIEYWRSVRFWMRCWEHNKK